VAIVQFDLAGNALETQDNARSRDLYERAVQTFDKVLGAAHPYAAMARSRIALLDERAGQALKAEAGIRQALPLLERSVGPSHPWYLLSLVTLANLRKGAGDLQQAEQIERDALEAVERTHQEGTLIHATLLNNLADAAVEERQRGSRTAFKRSSRSANRSSAARVSSSPAGAAEPRDHGS
jgi:tetratricopeptide (TPR) repeat protein